MFRITDRRTLLWPVTVSVPQPGGRTAQHTFKAEFEALTQEEMTELTKAGEDLLKRVLVGWPEGEVKDETDAPLAFSEAARDRLVDIPYVRAALFAAYGDIQSGRAAPRKN